MWVPFISLLNYTDVNLDGVYQHAVLARYLPLPGCEYFGGKISKVNLPRISVYKGNIIF